MKNTLALILLFTACISSAQDITTFPYFTGFEGQEGTLNENFPEGWTSEDGNTIEFGNQGWQIIKNSQLADNALTDSTAVHMFSHASETNDDWLFTPSIQMFAGTTYSLTFWVKVNLFGGTSEKLKIHAAESATSTAMLMNAPLWSNDNLTNTDYEMHTVSFSPATDGNYHFAFHYFSADFQYLLFVDDVTIDEEGAASVALLDRSDYKFLNPIKDQIQVWLNSEPKENQTLKVYNKNGQEVISVQSFSSMINQDVSALNSGSYMVEIQDSKGQVLISEKLIKL